MNNPAGSRKTEHSTPATPWESIDPNEPAGVALLAPPTDEPEVTVYNAGDIGNATPRSLRLSPQSDTVTDALHRAASDLQAFNRDHEFDFTQNEKAMPAVSDFVIPDEMVESLNADIADSKHKSEVVRTLGGKLEEPGERHRPAAVAEPIQVNSTPEIEEPKTVSIDPKRKTTTDDLLDKAQPDKKLGKPAILSPLLSEKEVDEEEESYADGYQQVEAQCWEDPELEEEATPISSGAGWTIPVLCAGIGLIACCVVIPQADANRRMAYEKQVLQADLDSIQKQVVVNDEFLKRVMDDPNLSERLAQRQLKRVRKGQQVLHLDNEKEEMSPFQIVAIAPPPPPAPYKPAGGIIASLCYEPHTRLYVMGAAMTMIASGLVMGTTKTR